MRGLETGKHRPQPESCQFTRLVPSSYWAQKDVEVTSALSISCVKKPMQKGGQWS